VFYYICAAIQRNKILIDHKLNFPRHFVPIYERQKFNSTQSKPLAWLAKYRLAAENNKPTSFAFDDLTFCDHGSSVFYKIMQQNVKLMYNGIKYIKYKI